MNKSILRFMNYFFGILSSIVVLSGIILFFVFEQATAPLGLIGIFPLILISFGFFIFFQAYRKAREIGDNTNLIIGISVSSGILLYIIYFFITGYF